ncbi:hypothetical protein Tco_0914986, partial [Tanacetum coccineum]
MDLLRSRLLKETKHKKSIKTGWNEGQMQTTEDKVDSSKALDASLVDTESSGTALKEQDTSSRSGNDAHADDADIRPIYDEEPMAEVQTTAEINVFAIGQQHTEQPEFNNEGEVMKPKVKHDIDVIETINIELEHKVAKLLKENETLKQHYKEMYDSIKTTRARNIEHTTSLIAKNDDFKAQLQEKGFAIAALKNELRKLTGHSVNTKFAKSSILGKPALQPRRNQSVVRQPTAFKSERPRISKQRFTSQVDVNNDLSKPVTPHYLPKERESAVAKPHHMIAPGSSRYSSNDMVHKHYLEEAKKKTQDQGGFPTGKDIQSSITKVDSEPPNGSNADITNQYECGTHSVMVQCRTLNLSAAMTSDHNSSELGIHDHNNELSSSKLVPKVVPQADKTATSRQELELLFHHHITMLRNEEALPPQIRQNCCQYICCQNHMLIADIEDDIMDPVMQCTTLPSHSGFSQQKPVSLYGDHTTSIDFLTPNTFRVDNSLVFTMTMEILQCPSSKQHCRRSSFKPFHVYQGRLFSKLSRFDASHENLEQHLILETLSYEVVVEAEVDINKRTKNQAKKSNKTGRGMEKGVKAKPNQSQVYSEKKKQ